MSDADFQSTDYYFVIFALNKLQWKDIEERWKEFCDNLNSNMTLTFFSLSV